MRGDGKLADSGPIVFDTGRFTGRSPKDKHIVREPQSEGRVWWGGNNAISEEHFDGIREKITDYLSGQDLYVVDAWAGADPKHRIAVRVVT